MTAALQRPLADLSISAMPARDAPAQPSTQQLPELDFNFDALRGRMAAFTRRFDSFIATSRAQLLEARAAHRLSQSRATEETASLRRQIEEQAARDAAHAQVLAAQQHEAGEMRDKVRELEGVRDERRDALEALRARLEAVQGKLAGRRAGARQREVYASQMRSQGVAELETWETALGMRIEGAGSEDCVRFLFDMAEEAGTDAAERRSVSFELDMSGLVGGGGGGGEGEDAADHGYKVAACTPRVDAMRIEGALAHLAQNEELGRFLAEMRSLLLEAAAAR